MSLQDTPTATDYDVAVSGLGPVGLFSAILLGRKGYRVIGFDRWPTPYPLPRAVTFDHEIARILNVIGIDADADPAIAHYDSVYRWQNAAGETLMEIDWKNTAHDGWRNRYWFSQPALEARLREVAASLPNVTLMPGFEVQDFEQSTDLVRVSYRETVVQGILAVPKEDGQAGSVTARFLIGSDGANSTTRQRLGLEPADQEFYYDWLVVDLQPELPLVYDPPHYQVCDPARPTTVVPGGPGRNPGDPDRRRWEFMALPGESREELGRPEKVWELLRPFDVTPDNAVLERAVVWRFQAKHLEQWRVGRVALAGDAAHLMPPFAGEGMCAGLRDANNLCWRLDLALRGLADPSVLDGYCSERKPHVKWYIDFSVGIGKVICVTDEAEAAERDRRLIAEHQEHKARGPISPHEAVLGPGAWVEGDEHAGKPSVQSRVAHRGAAGRFDEVVGRGWTLISAPGHEQPLSAEQQALFAEIDGTSVTVGAAGSGADVIDVEGVYTAWMRAHDVTHLLVRPDFYVAATAATGEQMRRAFDRIVESLSLRMPTAAV
ncbi:bifunctional 3-(3-hydroxy-phenyl)propionate/3-hydroxycinnamic acid hydroxylase [Geodermatophilus sp. TF02-6]|uniref:bifunctional 3-(3-hydroxy-phenyl)propionate/3-hydroxycinnamic acid hydroxylase MhpA n=1 Tax=Geodermatophilus sp. TF02-6 TaxID=2250575 RepID=UPI000DEA94B1|nr:bifunctional 3-(3-hydroxy-phenyl)propionate/3-hydroxycinnamic acid hydroxylase [Geodermatophilus sp. TF02-6]RBY83818.1 bifunctional 3-(3-hydroxy-phenyl)propionate/3-hydroxycinnamic acid hydroxylase [Geodermatophilus sp. TF02-6]